MVDSLACPSHSAEVAKWLMLVSFIVPFERGFVGFLCSPCRQTAILTLTYKQFRIFTEPNMHVLTRGARGHANTCAQIQPPTSELWCKQLIIMPLHFIQVLFKILPAMSLTRFRLACPMTKDFNFSKFNQTGGWLVYVFNLTGFIFGTVRGSQWEKNTKKYKI